MDVDPNFEEDHSDLTPDAKQALESGSIHQPETDEDDIEQYGRKVKKRIYKEISKRKVVETRAEQAETRAERLERQLREATERLNGYEERENTSLDEQEADLKLRRDKALDEGEIVEATRLGDELYKVQLDKRERVIKRDSAPIEREEEPAPASEKPNITPAARAWVEENDWIQTDTDRAAKAAQLEKTLVGEGYKTSDPELYAELDRRLGGDETIGDIVDDLDEEPETPRVGATTGVQREAVQHRQSARQGVLTRADLSRMQRAGFDPNSPADRKGWMDRNKPL